jgi:ribosomal protein S27E
MTMLCAAALGEVPGVRPCAEWDEHRITCLDHPGYTRRPGTCRGCLPKSADRGFLCEHHFEQVEAAVAEWPRWRRLVVEAGWRTISPSGGDGGTALGYTALTLAHLALDECGRHLRSFTQDRVELWVSTEDGARDALLFAAAATRAYRDLEVEPREVRFERVRCPSCDRLSLQENPTRVVGGSTVVECQHCGARIAKVHTPAERTVSSTPCDRDEHVACDRLGCRCPCHDLGSQHANDAARRGIHVIWNADVHAFNPSLREGWIITDPHTITRTGEETRAA